MHFSTIATTAALAAVAIAAPVSKREDAVAANIGLSVNASQFYLPLIQTTRISYANSSAYIGQVKYETYSEPLVVSNPAAAASDDASTVSLAFQSIHSTPTGQQVVYVLPGQSAPVQLSPPHGSPPAGAVSTGFALDGADANLQLNGANKFHACQDAALQALGSYQIYWIDAGLPGAESSVSCITDPLQILASDAAARV